MNQSYLLLLLACLSAVCWGCVHDTFAKNVNIVVHNDVDDIRLLQSNTIGPYNSNNIACEYSLILALFLLAAKLRSPLYSA